MGPENLLIAKTLPIFNRLFPRSHLEQLWAVAQPRKYRYKMAVWILPGVMLSAYIRRLPSLDAILAEYASTLAITSKSTLSGMLRNAAFARLVCLMLEEQQDYWDPAEQRLVLLDSMAFTISARRRSDAEKVNDKTLGGGVLWAYLPDASAGKSPVRLLKVMRGAWNDCAQMRGLDFIIPNGPIYVLDRGFFGFDLLRLWLDQQVHFIVRAKKNNVTCYTVVREIRHTKKVGGLRVLLDAVVDLGKSDPVRVRMIKAVVASGELLILISDLLKEKAASVLADYKRRWEVERFHYFVKSAIGLAHFYSFAMRGLEILTQLALFLAALIWMGQSKECEAGQTLVQQLLRILRSLRKGLTSATAWRRNTCQRLFRNCKKGRASPA